jgi:hypothetical protein
MKKHLLLCLIVLTLIQCHKGSVIVDPGPLENITVKSGASFGECLGYCRREIEINGTQITYTQSGWNTEVYPPVITTGEITVQEWNRLAEMIDCETLKNMEDVYGCPDCVDQGAEWIEIIHPDFSKKITFEFGDSLEEIQDLLSQLRGIRLVYENKSSI